MQNKTLRRGCRKFTAMLLAAAMLVTGVPMTAFAAEEPQYLPEHEIDPEVISDGQFYLGTAEAELQEDAESDYLLKIGRYGTADTDASVRVTMMDVNAAYGKDYKVELYDGSLFDAGVQNASDAESVLSYVQKNAAEEYNYSDAIVDGSIAAEDQLSEEEAQAVAFAVSCGVRVITSVHAPSLSAVSARRKTADVCTAAAFPLAAVMAPNHTYALIREDAG